MSQNNKELDELMRAMLKNIKNAHKDLIKNLSKDQAEELNLIVEKKINEEKFKQNNSIMNDFFKTVYGK